MKSHLGFAGATLANVTNLPTIPPGGSHNGYWNVKVANLSALAWHLPTPRAMG